MAIITRLKAYSPRWWIALAAAVLAVAGISLTLSDWGRTGSANAADWTGSADLNVVWTGQLSKFPGNAWRDAWGVTAAGAQRLEQLQMATDDTAPGGRALIVTYPAGSATPSCLDCQHPGGVEFRARTAPVGGGTDLSDAHAVDLRYSVKFPREFDFGLGGSLPGLYGTPAGVHPGTGPTGTPRATGTPDPSDRPHATASPTATRTPRPTSTPTMTPDPTRTPNPTSTPSATSTPDPGAPAGAAGWSTRLIWRVQGGGVAGGLQLVPPAGSGSAQDLGVGTFTFAADDQWHAVEQRLELDTNKITLWYDRTKVFSGSLASVSGVPAAGMLFTSFFGGADTSWGPGTDVVAEFAGFTIRADLAVPSASVEPSPDGSETASTTATPTSRSTKTPKATATPTATGGTGTKKKFYITLYGAHDNDPPNSREIAYPKIHDEAGGSGTYDDPFTFAAGAGDMKPGTVIYYSYLKRYFILEDECASCESNHIDLWAGASNDPEIEDCEADLTRNGEVIIDPPDGLPVDSGEVYSNGKCYSPGG